MQLPAMSSSFLGIEGCHAFVTGAAGGIGSAIVKELLGRSQVTGDYNRLTD